MSIGGDSLLALDAMVNPWVNSTDVKCTFSKICGYAYILYLTHIIISVFSHAPNLIVKHYNRLAALELQSSPLLLASARKTNFKTILSDHYYKNLVDLQLIHFEANL